MIPSAHAPMDGESNYWTLPIGEFDDVYPIRLFVGIGVLVADILALLASEPPFQVVGAPFADMDETARRQEPRR